MTYHPGNLKLQPYPHDKVIELAQSAEKLGVQFKINGIPFGAPYDSHLWEKFHEQEGLCSPARIVGDRNAKALGSADTRKIVGASVSTEQQSRKDDTL